VALCPSRDAYRTREVFGYQNLGFGGLSISGVMEKRCLVVESRNQPRYRLPLLPSSVAGSLGRHQIHLALKRPHCPAQIQGSAVEVLKESEGPLLGKVSWLVPSVVPAVNSRLQRKMISLVAIHFWIYYRKESAF
jgi:hypothetical protein